MNTGDMIWRQAIPGQMILKNEVHVWRVCLDVTALQYESLLKSLSVDEVTRAERFYFERDRKRFITSRGILRQLLGSYLAENPAKLHFEYTPQGKPVLAPNSGFDMVRFNLSHADAFALYAFSPGRDIGVDIERIRDDVEVVQIAQRFFAPKEISALEHVDKNKQIELFFQYWTRKEAVLKALGVGISFPMEQCDVSGMNACVSLPVTFLNNIIKGSNWYGLDLFPGEGYAAAIAVEGNGWNLSCWQYTE